MKEPRHYSNEVTSGVLHLIGAVSALALLVIMIVFASLYGTAWHVVSFTIYGVFMMLLYLASTLYHLVPHRKVVTKDILQRIDHAMVYLFIAATYTPVAFIVLFGWERWFVFFLLWTLAILGAVVKLVKIKLHGVVPVVLYVTMGWIIVFFWSSLIENMESMARIFLVLGGVSYTIGVIFFALEAIFIPRKYFWMHEIFHIFVLLGTVSHTVVMFYLL
ncbi:MAG: hemolysin [Patescibacteria group bacterium]|nr:hemolysin [Patescibacteria group bacterium]